MGDMHLRHSRRQWNLGTALAIGCTAFGVGLIVGGSRHGNVAISGLACSAATLKCHDIPGGKITCMCDGRPLGAGTAKDMSAYYPFGNESLASIYDTEAYLHDALVPLSQFRAKAILIGNTASN